MSVVQVVKDDIFAEPNGHPLSWAAVGWGVVLIGSVASGFIEISSGFVLMGLGFMFMGGAELVPADRRQTAGVFRLCSIAVFALLGLQYVIELV